MILCELARLFADAQTIKAHIKCIPLGGCGFGCCILSRTLRSRLSESTFSCKIGDLCLCIHTYIQYATSRFPLICWVASFYNHLLSFHGPAVWFSVSRMFVIFQAFHIYLSKLYPFQVLLAYLFLNSTRFRASCRYCLLHHMHSHPLVLARQFIIQIQHLCTYTCCILPPAAYR